MAKRGILLAVAQASPFQVLQISKSEEQVESVSDWFNFFSIPLGLAVLFFLPSSFVTVCVDVVISGSRRAYSSHLKSLVSWSWLSFHALYMYSAFAVLSVPAL